MKNLKNIIKSNLDKLCIKYKDTGYEWLLIQCLNPIHNDTNPSVFLNTLSGYGRCQSCNYVIKPKDLGLESNNTLDIIISNYYTNLLNKLGNKDDTNSKNKVTLPPKSNKLFDYRGFSKEFLTNVGVYYCEAGKFSGRLIFPFYNHKNELIAYTGRAYNNNLLFSKFKDAKYLHSPNIKTNYNLLYGKLIQQFNLPKDKGLVLVEGNLDALALLNKGIPASPLLGFKKPTLQVILEIIELGFDKVILAFDNDEAGLKHLVTKEDASLFSLWNKQIKVELPFYCEYPLVKLLYKTNKKDFHALINKE